MAAAAAAGRSFFRSSSTIRTAAAKIAGSTRSPPVRHPRQPPIATSSPRFLRSPVEMSCCVESLLPMYSAIASAKLISMLSPSSSSDFCCWVLRGPVSIS